MRYFVIFARCADGAYRLHVDASSLLDGAPHRSSTQSFGLYAISRSTTRSATSLSASVHKEPSLRGYENLRAASSDTSTLCNSAFTLGTLFSFGIAYRSGRRATRSGNPKELGSVSANVP